MQPSKFPIHFRRPLQCSRQAISIPLLSTRRQKQCSSHSTIQRWAPQNRSRAMSSDEAYSSFLDQANQDTGASKISTKSSSAKTKAVDSDIPSALQSIEQYYTSEADEPFEPVSLKWSGSNMPSESMLSLLIHMPLSVVREFS